MKPVLLVASLAGALVAASPASAAFPGDNGRIAFVSISTISTQGATGVTDIRTMAGDGSDVRVLTADAAIDSDPSYSPGGTKIAFASDRTGGGDIYLMNADGTEQRRVTTDPADESNPAFSPDGTRLVFRALVGGRYDIFTINLDGTGRTNLTRNAANDSAPVYSPDGRRIAFVSDRDGGDSEIYLMGADGSQPTRLTTTAGTDADPDWSPDGQRIAFRSQRTGNREIFTMSADGSGQTNFTGTVTNERGPAWSPDGSRIVFARAERGVIRLVSRAVSGGEVGLSAARGSEDAPSWGSAVGGRPRITGARMTRSRFRVRSAFVFDLTKAASVRIRIEARRSGRTVNLGTLVRTGVTGRNRLSFNGRVRGRRLRAGTYRARLIAIDPEGNLSTPRAVRFTIVRR